MIELLVFALVSGAIGSAIGQSKGRPTAGFLWGVFTGPLGWILVAVGPNMKPKCPACKGVVEDGAIKCRHCGASIGFNPAEYERLKQTIGSKKPAAVDPVDAWEQQQQTAPRPRPVPKPVATVPCPLCNASIKETALVVGMNTCSYCGGTFEAE